MFLTFTLEERNGQSLQRLHKLTYQEPQLQGNYAGT